MLSSPSARRKFSEWCLARRILIYNADSAILPKGNNVLGLLRKFRAEAGLSVDPRSSGAPSASPRKLQLNWLMGGFQAVFRERQSLLDFNFATNDDDDDGTPSPPSYVDLDLEQSDPTSMTSRQVTLSMPLANRPALLRTKHLPMSAFNAGSTTSQRSGSTRHKLYFGQQQSGPRDPMSTNLSAAPAPTRAELVSRLSSSGPARRNLFPTRGLHTTAPGIALTAHTSLSQAFLCPWPTLSSLVYFTRVASATSPTLSR